MMHRRRFERRLCAGRTCDRHFRIRLRRCWRQQLVTLTVTDASSNTAICVATVTVVDSIAPTIECPADIAVSNDDGECGAVVEFDDPEVDDNCPLDLNGPSGQAMFSYTGNIETWTVPAGVTSITIEARGAEGGNSNSSNFGPGQGAILSGDFAVTPGQQLKILVGQKPQFGNGNGGGGGTFVTDISNNPLIIAGGGGGSSNADNPNKDAQLGTAGGDGPLGGGAGGDNGEGGKVGVGFYQGGGAGGLLTDGEEGSYSDDFGKAFVNGGAGGLTFAVGGFGGGGHGSAWVIGGAGGGYSGGGAGSNVNVEGGGGGGGSFNGGANSTAMVGNTGHGLVNITWNVTGGALVQTTGLPSGSLFPIGTTINTFVITDESGNTASCSFEVTVTDDEIPEIACPANVTINTDNLGTEGDCFGQYEWEHPTATDNCAIQNYSVRYTDPDGNEDGPYDVSPFDAVLQNIAMGNRDFAVGTTTVSYYVIDEHGNTNTCTFTVTVNDNEDPAFVACPPDVTLTVDVGNCSAVHTWDQPQATDNCEVTITQTGGPLPGSTFNVGTTYTIEYTATDNAGNSVTCTWNINVIDTQDPTAVCQDITIYLDANGEASIVPADVDGGSTDDCMLDGLAIDIDEFDCDSVGDNNVTLTVTDASDNTSICVATVTVLDTIKPVITNCPASPVFIDDCDALVPNIADTIQATDECGIFAIFQDPIAGLDFASLNGDTIDITITAVDNNGNVTTCVVRLEVDDITPPEFVNCPTQMVMIGNDPDQCSGKLNWSIPVATDDCELASIVQTEGPLPGTVVDITCPPTPSQITYLATDMSGNTATCTFEVMVIDTQEPEFDADIVMPNDTTVDCHLVPTNCVYHGPDNCLPLDNNDVNDNCTDPADITIDFDEVSTQDPDPSLCQHYTYDLTRTWTVTDCAGNSLQHTQMIQVQDTTKPTALCKDITVTLDPFGVTSIVPTDIDNGSFDNCAAYDYLTFTASKTDFGCLDLGENVVTLFVTDPCGNVGTCTAIVTVEEGIAKCDPEYDFDGSDPCVCLNNATNLTDGQFSELIQIHALAGQTWELVAVNGLYLTSSPAPPAAPDPVLAGAMMINGLNDGLDNNGDGVIDDAGEIVFYTFQGIHVDGIGYTATLRNNLGQELTLDNKCYYPTPIFTNLDDAICLSTPEFEIDVVDNFGANGNVINVMVNGVPTNLFNAADLGLGFHTIMATFDAGTASPNLFVNGVLVGVTEAEAIADPGCEQKITKIVQVVTTPNTVTCNDTLHVSLDASCLATITADDVLEGSYSCFDDYTVILTYPNGTTTYDPPNQIDASHVGHYLPYTLEHYISGNTCWGYVLVEDKLAPELECPGDITVACSESTEPDNTGDILITDCLPTSTQIDDEFTDFGQCENPRAQIVRTWYVTDSEFNQSSCSHTITITQFDFADMVWPADVTIDCEDNYLNPAGTDPANTGAPSINNYPIGVGGLCSASISYTDEVFDICPGSFEILRTWKVRNTCLPVDDDNPVEHTQVIQVLDFGGPEFDCPDNITVSVDPVGQCCATAALPDVIVTEGCSNITDLVAKVTGVDTITNNTITFTVDGSLADFPGNNYWDADTLAVFTYTECLPRGIYTVEYTAGDQCSNQSSCEFEMVVADIVPPAVSCDEFTQVALGGNGEILVNASTFDDGTYDNCSDDVWFKARRMDQNTCDSVDVFDDQVKFCCEDQGDTITVVFRAYDMQVPAGEVGLDDFEPHYNDCMVQVFVEDKVKPVCESPDDVEVTCENFDPSLWAYGFAEGLDNCCLDTITVSDNYALFDTLCNKGTITRTFRVFDCAANSTQCTQRIIVEYVQDYYVRFPDDVIVNECNGTGVYGEPTFFGEDCEAMGVSFEDEIFTVVPDACYKIERTWDVINWCTYNPNLPLISVPNPNPNATSNHPSNLPGPIVSAAGAAQPWAPTIVKINPDDPTPTNYSTFWLANANGYRYKQIIKIVDGEDPVFDDCPTDTVEVCDLTENDGLFWNDEDYWDAGIESHDLCEAPAELCITVTDSCGGADVNIRYLLYLDMDGDGVMETEISSTNQPDPNEIPYLGGTPFDLRPVPFNQKYRFAIDWTDNGNARTACVRWDWLQQPVDLNDNALQGVVPQLPYGMHKIKWIAEDGCGNEAICEYTFEVKDCKKPTVVCLNGLSVNIMPGGMITLWDSDFLQYGEDNCTPADLLVYGIVKSSNASGSFPVDGFGNPITNVTFDCSELGPQPVQLWAMDVAGNADFCETYVIVQDNMGNCNPGDNVTVAGTLATEMQEGLEEADVQLTGQPQGGIPPFDIFDVSDNSGFYIFSNALPLSSNYVVTPLKDDNPLNGVTTFDLVLISKHILGLEPLDSPYKMIAADANKSNSVTTFDIVELRKLILGIYAELPNNTSWRFVDHEFQFTDPLNPFIDQFPETKSVADIQSDIMNDDFVAVKIGDVNESAIANSLMSSDDRSGGTLMIDLDDRKVAQGETFEVTFTAAEQVLGYQFTLNLEGLEVLDVIPGREMSMDNFGVFSDAITTSYDGKAVGEFTVRFRAMTTGDLREMLAVSSRITKAEAYGDTRLDVALRFNGSIVAGLGFEVYQNTPNPWVDRTQIGFYLPQDNEVRLTIYDESGRMLFTQKGEFAKGYNSFFLDRQLIDGTGILYYTVSTDSESATMKMIQTK